jgi:hypothetical protein
MSVSICETCTFLFSECICVIVTVDGKTHRDAIQAMRDQALVALAYIWEFDGDPSYVKFLERRDDYEGVVRHLDGERRRAAAYIDRLVAGWAYVVFGRGTRHGLVRRGL